MAAAAYLARYSNEGTRSGYARDLRAFFAWSERNVPRNPLNATRVMLQWYVRHLEVERGYTPQGIQRAMVAVRGLFRTAVMDELLTKDPTVGVVTPRVVPDPTSRRVLTRHQLADLVAAAAARGPVDLALVHLLATVALRVSEACAIQVEDLSRQQGWPCVRVVQKGRKPAFKVLPLPVHEAVTAVVAGRPAGPLLTSGTGRQMTRRVAAHRIERIGQAAGVGHRVHPHELRRTHITHALRSGVDLRVVSRSVGHARTDTTLGYDALGVDLAVQSPHFIAQMLATST